MTTEQLSGCSKKKLEALARREGIAGWKSMRKEQLIHVLGRLKAKKKPDNPKAVVAKPTDGKAVAKPKPQKSAARDTSSSPSSASLLEQQVERSKYEVGGAKDLSVKTAPDLPEGYTKDRIVTMVRDPFWLHVYWELTHNSIQRAEAALGQDWHGAKPILRLLDVSAHETTSTSEAVVRDVEIHGGCQNWYLEVKDPPKSYRVDIGYTSRRGNFYVVSRSNVVTTPRPNVSDVIDENWSDIDAASAERIFAMSAGFDPNQSPSSLELKELFEERLRRPMAEAPLSSVTLTAPNKEKGPKKFWFQLDAELIVYGATEPTAKVVLQGEPVKLRP